LAGGFVFLHGEVEIDHYDEMALRTRPNRRSRL
jgi:hypothetical protein